MKNWVVNRSYLLAVKAVMRSRTKLTILGKENIPDPADGGLLIISNHFSVFEIPFLYTKLPVQPNFFATFELLETPWIGLGIKAHQDKLIFINRSEVDRKALKAGIDKLKTGEWVTIFPEGSITRESIDTAARGEPTAHLPFYWTRHDPVEILPARPGTAWMALQAKVPVLPIAFEGTEKIEQNLTLPKRTEVKMHIGKPLGPFEIPAGVRGQAKKDLIDQFGHEMMRSLAGLLPQKYWGDILP
ncbi:MAG: lysophospholipid acyltransferase family protein [Chloroflexota bacterium]